MAKTRLQQGNSSTTWSPMLSPSIHSLAPPRDIQTQVRLNSCPNEPTSEGDPALPFCRELRDPCMCLWNCLCLDGYMVSLLLGLKAPLSLTIPVHTLPHSVQQASLLTLLSGTFHHGDICLLLTKSLVMNMQVLAVSCYHKLFPGASFVHIGLNALLAFL